MDSERAIALLMRQKSQIPLLSNKRNDPAFSKWKRDTRVAINHIFNGNARHLNDFDQIRYSMMAISSYTSEHEKTERYNKGLAEANALLESMIDEVEIYGGEVNKKTKEIPIGQHVFLGHGRSSLWRELKDFIQDKLNLSYEEFNRVPVAGLPNTYRLQQMLDNSCIAFLIMTAEDEMQDGNKQARMNVIHEVGLFQGRLGFEKAIVLLEEGCEEFTNINGLGQVRFPKGKISAIFQDVREVLEREGILTDKK